MEVRFLPPERTRTAMQEGSFRNVTGDAVNGLDVLSLQPTPARCVYSLCVRLRRRCKTT